MSAAEPYDIDFEYDYAMRMIDEGNYLFALKIANDARLFGYKEVAKKIQDGVRTAQAQVELGDESDED